MRKQNKVLGVTGDISYRRPKYIHATPFFIIRVCCYLELTFYQIKALNKGED